MVNRFRNRIDAGRRLAEALATLEPRDGVVLGLPRGGVMVAAEFAAALRAPLDVIGVAKLSLPERPELAIGAIADGMDQIIRNETAIAALGITDDTLEQVRQTKAESLRRRIDAYRAARPPCPLENRQAIIIDDGMATGATARAAVTAARWRGADSVVVATPVAAPEAVRLVGELADDVVCLHAPLDFRAVGASYDDFRQTTDDEVTARLQEGAEP